MHRAAKYADGCTGSRLVLGAPRAPTGAPGRLQPAFDRVGCGGRSSLDLGARHHVDSVARPDRCRIDRAHRAGRYPTVTVAIGADPTRCHGTPGAMTGRTATARSRAGASHRRTVSSGRRGEARRGSSRRSQVEGMGEVLSQATRLRRCGDGGVCKRLHPGEARVRREVRTGRVVISWSRRGSEARCALTSNSLRSRPRASASKVHPIERNDVLEKAAR